MTSAIQIRAAWAVLLIAVGAGSVEAQTGPHQDFVCMSATSRRVVSVFNLDDSGARQQRGCRVDYTKDGETRTVYTSKTGRAYCAAKAASLVTTLVNGNYSCRAQTLEKNEDPEFPEH